MQINILQIKEKDIPFKVAFWIAKHSSAFYKSEETLDILYQDKLLYSIKGFRVIQEIYKSIPQSVVDLKPSEFKLLVKNLLKVLIKREIIFLLNLKKKLK